MSSQEIDPEKANLVELWKRSELIKFQEYLGQLEAERMGQLKQDLERVKKVEKKLKLKLVQVENKERELAGAETDLQRTKDESLTRLKRQTEDHQVAIKLLNEQHAAALKLERGKLKAEEGRRRALELASVKPEVSGSKISKCSTPNTERDSRIRELESELKLTTMALEQSRERESVLIKSRDYFRSAVLRLTAAQQGGLIRMQQMRAELLSSGLYEEEDEVIGQLDLKILKAVKNCA
jgi:hypothetical protein